VAELTVTEAQDGETFTVQVGDAILMQLPENASTGYRWAVSGIDEGCVRVEDAGYRAVSPAVGSGGVASWRLRVLAPGETRVELKRWRAFEGESSVTERFSIGLRIRPRTP
jgi:inhibitor of cysteine peptidase